jgi:hypothetical protein
MKIRRHAARLRRSIQSEMPAPITGPHWFAPSPSMMSDFD